MSEVTTVSALQEALKAEHAAVYGYGVLGAKLRGASQDAARSLWDDHRAQRDELISRLAALGVRAEAAAPAYKLPVRPTSGRTAAQLATVLERDVVTAYAGLAGAPDPALRTMAAREMQQAMARSVRWQASAGTGRVTGPSGAFPGLPDSSLSPAPEPGGGND
ncbi:ferritin-like domain-containing protein [Actinomadura gamaensis]|uniref:Ferritin-like domain-containing protein n=1 Tax=Actinomadura gamaensis TaxID=1763541 RepID=A0ABV9TT11_9ACTN